MQARKYPNDMQLPTKWAFYQKILALVVFVLSFVPFMLGQSSTSVGKGTYTLLAYVSAFLGLTLFMGTVSKSKKFWMQFNQFLMACMIFAMVAGTVWTSCDIGRHNKAKKGPSNSDVPSVPGLGRNPLASGFPGLDMGGAGGNDDTFYCCIIVLVQCLLTPPFLGYYAWTQNKLLVEHMNIEAEQNANGQMSKNIPIEVEHTDMI